MLQIFFVGVEWPHQQFRVLWKKTSFLKINSVSWLYCHLVWNYSMLFLLWIFFFMNNKHNNNEFPILLSGYIAITVYEGHIFLSQYFHRCFYRVKCLLPQYSCVCLRKSIGLDSVQFTAHQYILTINSKRRTKINCIISIK